MHTARLLPALVALGAGLVSAESCSSNVKITEANQAISCDTIGGDLVVDDSVSGDVIIDGPSEIKGDLTIKNASAISSLSSTTIRSIGGTFTLDGLTKLGSIDMGAIREVDSILFNNLPFLTSLMLGSTGLTKASSIKVTDTFLDDLSQFNVAEVASFFITNNNRLTTWDSDLVNISTTLVLQGNGQASGQGIDITMDSLKSAAEMEIASVKSLSVKSLEKVTGSLKFNKNVGLAGFAAPNLTSVTNDVSFTNNSVLSNITFPLVTSISSLTITGNTKLTSVVGFPELKTITGSIDIGGAFKKVELPKLNDVKGSVNVTSTADISDFCDFFDNAKSDGKIQGQESCTSKNPDAESGSAGGGQSNGSGGSGDNGDNGDDGGAAGITSVNMALLGLTLLAGLAQFL